MQDNRPLILGHALRLAPFDGWSEATLREAGKRAGLDNIAIQRAFPTGVNGLLDYFFTSSDEALAESFPEGTLASKRMPERIEALLLARFGYWRPHKEAVRRAVAAQSLPWNTLSSIASVARTVDLMWRLAGDAATDFSYYTKRATLMGIYSSTTLCWLNDESEGEADTRRFLKRRLDNVAAFGKWKKQMQGKAKRWGV